MGDEQDQNLNPGESKPGKSNKKGPVDLNRRKLALEMEKELGGLFGIELSDIEDALARLYAGKIETGQERIGELPEPVQRSIHYLDGIGAAVETLIAEEKISAAGMVLELMEKRLADLTQKLQ